MPAGLPSGIPGIADVMEGAIQHAPHPGRQPVSEEAMRVFGVVIVNLFVVGHVHCVESVLVGAGDVSVTC